MTTAGKLKAACAKARKATETARWAAFDESLTEEEFDQICEDELEAKRTFTVHLTSFLGISMEAAHRMVLLRFDDTCALVSKLA